MAPREQPRALLRLGLESGEWVDVGSRDEILQTLDTHGRHRGLSFGTAMYEQCGRRMKVLKPVDQIIVERTGKLRPMQDTVILE